MGGRICYEDRLPFGNECSPVAFSVVAGAYLLTISDVEQRGITGYTLRWYSGKSNKHDLELLILLSIVQC